MSAHTPGPWVLVGASIGAALGETAHGREPYAVIQTPDAALDIIAPRSMKARHVANATLIAAAPDLLAALEHCMVILEHPTVIAALFGEGHEVALAAGHEMAMREAQAATRKARS